MLGLLLETMLGALLLCVLDNSLPNALFPDS